MQVLCQSNDHCNKFCCYMECWYKEGICNNCKYFLGGSKLDLQELRRQQIRVGLLKAARVLLQHQDVLRKVLNQVVLPQSPSAPEADTTGSDDEGEADMPNLILHQLMVTATQPSPLKATFTREELEVRFYMTFLSYDYHLVIFLSPDISRRGLLKWVCPYVCSSIRDSVCP